MNIVDLVRNAHTTTDDQGQPVIQIPLQVWEQFVAEEKPKPSQKVQIESLLQAWDEASDEWWDGFSSFVKANRLDFKDE